MSSSNQVCRKRRRPTLFVSEGGTANLSTFFAHARFCSCRDCSDFRARSREQSGGASRFCHHARGRRCDRLVAREGQAVGVQRPTIRTEGLGPREGKSLSRHWPYGLMFWFTWKRLSGSYFRFTSTSRWEFLPRLAGARP